MTKLKHVSHTPQLRRTCRLPDTIYLYDKKINPNKMDMKDFLIY